MNRYLKRLQQKSKNLVEIANKENALEEGRKILKGLKKETLIKNAKKGLKKFYSKRSYKVLTGMVLADEAIFETGPEKDTMLLLYKKYSKLTDGTNKLDELNFFDLYEEMETQKLLNIKYPDEIFADELQLAKYTSLLESVTNLRGKVSEYARKNNLSASYNMKLGKRNANIKNYSDILLLIK